MAWQDRPYNSPGTGGGDGGGNSLQGLASFLTWSLPVGRIGGASIRLSFWMLLAFFFFFVYTPRTSLQMPTSHGLLLALIACVALFIGAALHELARRFVARRFGGIHDTLTLWSLGGMTAPSMLTSPRSLILTNLAGSAANLLVATLIAAALLPFGNKAFFQLPYWLLVNLDPSNSLRTISLPLALIQQPLTSFSDFVIISSLMLMFINLGIGLINLWPIYFLDGGYVLEGIATRFTSSTRAQYIAASTGMVLAALLFFFEIWRQGGAILMFGILFIACLSRWRIASASGGADPDWSGYREDAPASKRKRTWFGNRWAKAAAKRALKDRQEQEQIDAILAKVSEKGLHSLTRSEKRALQRATEKQRQADLVDRL